MSINTYLVRRAERRDIPLLPAIERRAVRQFEAWLKETGLTIAILEDVSAIEELEDAWQRGHL